MIASLPMYDVPELAEHTDALWGAIARALAVRGVRAPAALTRDRETWTDPALTLSQTCGYVFTHRLKGAVRLVATPRYAAPGCEGARYTSMIVVPRASTARSLEELRGRVAAVNQLESHSGMNVLRHLCAPLADAGRFFGRVEVSGGHRASLERIAAGTADVAAIDCVAHALLARAVPDLLAGTRVLAEVEAPRVPGLPLITRRDLPGEDLGTLREALLDVAEDPALARTRRALLWDGLEVLGEDAYAVLDEMEEGAIARGYPTVA